MEDRFIKALSKRMKRLYLEEVKKKSKEIEKEYRENSDDYIFKKRRGIEDDRKHREMINSCIVPFTERGELRKKTGYRFIRASPLFELGVKNVDFLLFKESERISIAIFGEAKGSVSEPGKIITQFRKRIKEINNNQEHIRKEYLNLPYDTNLVFEHVIAVPSGDSNEMLNRVSETGGGIIVWHAPVTGKEELSLSIPSKEIDNKIRKSMMHMNPDLRKLLLEKVETMRKLFNVFPQGHACSKLCALTSAIETQNEKRILIEQSLWRNLSQDLFYLSEEEKNKEMDWIIKQGIKINFLKSSKERSTYEVVSGRKLRRALEKDLERKWIKKAIQEDLDSKIKKTVEEIQSKYTIKPLNDWVK